MPPLGSGRRLDRLEIGSWRCLPCAKTCQPPCTYYWIWHSVSSDDDLVACLIVVWCLEPILPRWNHVQCLVLLCIWRLVFGLCQYPPLYYVAGFIVEKECIGDSNSASCSYVLAHVYSQLLCVGQAFIVCHSIWHLLCLVCYLPLHCPTPGLYRIVHCLSTKAYRTPCTNSSNPTTNTRANLVPITQCQVSKCRKGREF